MNALFKNAGYSLRLAAALIGTVVGAGFLSGTELVRFFPEAGYLPCVALSALLFAGCFWLLFLCGKKFGGYRGVLSALFAGTAPFFSAVMLVSSFIMCAGMLAGLAATGSEGFSLPAVLLPSAACVLLFFAGRGCKGLFTVNLLLVPFILAFIFSMAGEPWSAGGAEGTGAGRLLDVLAYVCMNCFLAAPLICDAGAEGKGGAGCAFAALITGVCAAVLLAKISSDAAAREAQMPVLVLLSGGVRVLFSLVCTAGILTTLFSSWYPLDARCAKGRRAALRRAALLAGAFLLSLMGLKHIVRFVYPIVGGAGAIFLAVCAARCGLLFDKPFFGKGDQRVHACGKHAQDHRRRHHEV